MTLKQRQKAIEWRRNKVLEYNSRGWNNVEIARELKISEATVSQDLKEIDKRAMENLSRYATEMLPKQMDRAIVQMEYLIKAAWKDYHDAKSSKERGFISEHIEQYNDTIMQILAYGPQASLLRRIQSQQHKEQLDESEEEVEIATEDKDEEST